MKRIPKRRSMGFPGYFLIVQDLIQAARDMGVCVGPGRGSAAGSAVAFEVALLQHLEHVHGVLLHLVEQAQARAAVEEHFTDKNHYYQRWKYKGYGGGETTQYCHTCAKACIMYSCITDDARTYWHQRCYLLRLYSCT